MHVQRAYAGGRRSRLPIVDFFGSTSTLFFLKKREKKFFELPTSEKSEKDSSFAESAKRNYNELCGIRKKKP